MSIKALRIIYWALNIYGACCYMLYKCDIHSHSKTVREVLPLAPFSRTCSLSASLSPMYKCAPLQPLSLTCWIFSTSSCTGCTSQSGGEKTKAQDWDSMCPSPHPNQRCAKDVDSFCLTWKRGWKLGRSSLGASSAAGELCVLGRITWCSCASLLIYKMRWQQQLLKEVLWGFNESIWPVLRTMPGRSPTLYKC